MHRIATILTTATLLALPAAAAGQPADQRSCGRFTGPDGSRIAVRIIHGHPSCATATLVLRGYLRSHAPCGGSACVRHRHGWTCASAGLNALPHLASCSKQRALIGAYTTFD